MVMNEQRMRFDKFISRIKNNPIVAFLIVFGTVVITLSTFTDAAKNLFSLINKPEVIDVTGKWVSQELSNPFSKSDKFKFHFDLEVKGNTVLGSIRQVSTRNRYDVRNGILDGRINNNIFSFYILERSLLGNETVSYKNFYNGSVLKGEIQFTLHSDRPWGFPPQKFIAKRE